MSTVNQVCVPASFAMASYFVHITSASSTCTTFPLTSYFILAAREASGSQQKVGVPGWQGPDCRRHWHLLRPQRLVSLRLRCAKAFGVLFRLSSRQLLAVATKCRKILVFEANAGMHVFLDAKQYQYVVVTCLVTSVRASCGVLRFH